MTDTTDYEHLLDKRRVLAVAYDEEADTVRTWVSEKLPLDDLAPNDVVAEDVPDDGPDTDVEDLGMGDEREGFDLQLLNPDDAALEPAGFRHSRHRPVAAGISECNARSTAATAGPYPARIDDTGRGEWASRANEGDIVRLSNAHVYARSGEAALGEDILQPSPYDDGDRDDGVGGLLGHLPLEDGVRADVAAREVDPDRERVTPHELSEEWPTAVRRDIADLAGGTVTKTGRTTGVTHGEVRAINASVRVQYPGRVVTLREQILTDAMSEGGDSGSPLYDDSGALVGLLFAGSPRVTVHNAIENVESDFGVTLMAEDPQDHIPEISFEDWVVDELSEAYGAGNVSRQFRFKDSGRIADIIVHVHGWLTLAIELENDSGSVVNGAGQAAFYAQEGREFWGNVVPVLGVPLGHIDTVERNVIQESGVMVREFDVPDHVDLSGV